jgi:hypothetical protein
MWAETFSKSLINKLLARAASSGAGPGIARPALPQASTF